MTSIFQSGLTVLLLVSSFALSGCGKGPVAEQAQQLRPAQQAEQKITAAVEKFLNAVRAGNDAEVFNMFSPKAREVCGRDHLPSIPASDTADFRIDAVHLVNDHEAQVRTTMIDLDENRQRVEEPIAWALRKTEEGWRIVGTAFVFTEGMEPVVVDFESREAIARAEAQVEAQLKARTQEWNATTQ